MILIFLVNLLFFPLELVLGTLIDSPGLDVFLSIKKLPCDTYPLWSPMDSYGALFWSPMDPYGAEDLPSKSPTAAENADHKAKYPKMDFTKLPPEHAVQKII